MRTQLIPYNGLEAFVAYPAEEKRPLVVLCHSWSGRDQYITDKAKWVASLGYVGFAIDMYGKLGRNKEENAALKQPFMDDRKMLLKTVLKGFDTALAFPFADKTKVAAIGFGFGGVCALDLARSGAAIKGAVSVYGHFESPGLPKKEIKSKILILHGNDDPIAPVKGLTAFSHEMKGVDFQVHLFSNTMHAFTNPHANDKEYGTVFNPESSKRAHLLIQSFLHEIFN